MAMSSPKSPGRTPPFILVALVLLVFILGYNYWVMSTSNKSLRDTNNKLTVESKDTAEKRLTAEKTLESIREEIRAIQGNYDQAKKSLQERETELNNLRLDKKTIEDELKTCKESMTKCDAELQTEKKNVERLTGEKSQLESSLKTAKEAKPNCGTAECIKPVQDILLITSKLVGTDAMSKALTDATLDVNKLMEGIEKIDPPVKG